MSTPYIAVAMNAFTIGTNNYLGSLKTFTLAADVANEDAAGVASENEYNVAVKSGQAVDFTMFANNLAGNPASNLDVSVFTIGGTSYIGSLKGGSLDITLTTKDCSPVNAFVKKPIVTRRGVELHTNLMVFSEAFFADAIINASTSVASLDVAVALTVFGEAFLIPMTMSSSNYKVDRGEIQMEDVTFKIKGTPTGPSDTTLVGLAMTGSATCALIADTGVKSYSTASGQLASIEKVSVSFNDAALVELTGRLTIQGALTVAAP